MPSHPDEISCAGAIPRSRLPRGYACEFAETQGFEQKSPDCTVWPEACIKFERKESST